MKEVVLYIPGKPHGKARHRAGIRGGRVVTYNDTTTSAYAYESLVEAVARQTMATHRLATFPDHMPLEVEFWAYFSPSKSWRKNDNKFYWPSKPDFDNIEKLIDGVVSSGLIPDDKQIVVNRGCYKVVDYNGEPGLYIKIREVAEETMLKVLKDGPRQNISKVL